MPSLHTWNWYVLNCVRLKSNLRCSMRETIWFLTTWRFRLVMLEAIAVLCEWTSYCPFKVHLRRQAFSSSASALGLWNQHFIPQYVPVISILFCTYIFKYAFFLKKKNVLSKSPVQLSFPPLFSLEHLYTLTPLHFVQRALSVCLWISVPVCVCAHMAALSHTPQHQMSNLHFSLVWIEGRRKRNKRMLVRWPPSRRKETWNGDCALKSTDEGSVKLNSSLFHVRDFATYSKS